MVNNVVLTLTEASRLTDPYYLFEFTNEYILGSESLYYSFPDISSFPNRYNQFEMDLDLMAGQYEYKVYESETETLDVSETTGRVLESGRMVIANDDDLITSGATGSNSSIYD